MDESARYIIGIDPGVTGAWALYDMGKSLFVGSWSFPLFVDHKPNRRRNAKPGSIRKEKTYDVAGWVNTVRPLVFKEKVSAWLEHVTSMPRDGSTQAFKFGRCYGEIRGALAGMDIPVTLQRPADWMRTMCPGAKTKKERKDRCRELLYQDGVADWATRSLNEGDVDAIMLMYRGVRYARNVREQPKLGL